MKEEIKNQLIKIAEDEINCLQGKVAFTKEHVEHEAGENYDCRDKNSFSTESMLNARRLEEIKNQLPKLRNLEVTKNHTISPGSLVTVSSMLENKKVSRTFFVTPYIPQEKTITVKEEKISLIDTKSNIFQKAKGKTAGNTFQLGSSPVEIIEIQ